MQATSMVMSGLPVLYSVSPVLIGWRFLSDGDFDGCGVDCYDVDAGGEY